jgi:predicted nucleic acid-binding protein
LIFVDTSFWIAYSNSRDPHHLASLDLLRDVGNNGLATTNHVRGETWTFLRRRTDHALAEKFLDRTERSSQVRLVFVSQELEADALKWLRRHDERPYSYVDATSFAVMRAMHIRDVLSYDEDFAVAGFRRVS